MGSNANTTPYQKAERMQAAAIRLAKLQGAELWRTELEYIEFATHYSEPGYSEPEAGLIAFGNWNEVSNWDPETRERSLVTKAPALLAEHLERAGISIEWSDEWRTCCECGGAVRTQPDSYSWLPSYVMTDDGEVCATCLRQDPAAYLETLEGDASKALTIRGIDPSEFGYVRYGAEGEFEAGMHPGQNDDPKEIAKSLEADGVTRYLFEIDSQGQFDTRFSVWVHEDETETVTGDESEEG